MLGSMANPSRPSGPRLAVVGARQTRHGVGAFLARHLACGGAEIAAVVGSRLLTAGHAADALEPALGYRPLPLAAADDLARVPGLDGVVIATPPALHEPWLRFAVERGLHALCEKPLVWGSRDAVTQAGALARRFVQRGLHLVVNAQWPRALDAFFALHPGLAPSAVTRLDLHLAPPSHGAEMLPDALPHALSLLYALAPDPRARLEGIEASWGDDEGRTLHLRLRYLAGPRALDAHVDLEQGGASPRAFALALDGRRAVRVVDDAYAMRLVDGTRSVPLPDPMARHAESFLALLGGGGPAEVDPSALPGVKHLRELADALPALAVPEIPYP